MMPNRMIEDSMPGTPADARAGAGPSSDERAGPRRKGRMKILKSLQRISSSPSLARIGRGGPSSNYRSGQKGSISCVSLSSSSSTSYGGHPYGATTSSTLSAVQSTAPTSTTSVAGSDLLVDASKDRSRIRPVELDSGTDVKRAPTTCPVPPARLPSNLKALSVNRTAAVSGSLATTATGAQVAATSKKVDKVDRWASLPDELTTHILRCLEPREIVRCSIVCRSWHRLCFDGQLWRNLDASTFYRDITADSLIKIITSAGPFVRDLNLRGCIQMRSNPRAERLVQACQNLEHVSLQGCHIGRSSVHQLIRQNGGLVHLDLTGLAAVWNATGSVVGQRCPRLRFLNLSWCSNMDSRGVRKIVDGCPRLEDLRVSELRGFDDHELMLRFFQTNRLRRLIMNGCSSLTNDALRVMIEGVNPELCPLTNRPAVPSRQLRYLDLSRCHRLTDAGVRRLAHQVPHLEGLQLGNCTDLTDASLLDLLPTVPRLTHLDLESLHLLTNATLQTLAAAPCSARLEHLSISYCENLGDTGMLAVLRTCTRIRNLDMDNTRVSDLVLAEAANLVRGRSYPWTGMATTNPPSPSIGLHLVVYDCQNVTWTGIREILARNANVQAPMTSSSSSSSPPFSSRWSAEVIQLKCYYGWQMTVDEHTKRVMRGDFAAATRLERKWAEYMMTNEEAGTVGAGSRRRRRRAREAAMLHADEEETGLVPGGSGTGGSGIGRRRRARSNGCVVM